MKRLTARETAPALRIPERSMDAVVAAVAADLDVDAGYRAILGSAGRSADLVPGPTTSRSLDLPWPPVIRVPRTDRLRRRRLRGGLLAAAASLAVLTVGLPATEVLRVQPASAAEILRRASEKPSAPTNGSGRYWYSQVRSAAIGGDLQLWQDGSGGVSARLNGAPADPATLPFLARRTWVQQLPTEPHRLFDELYAQAREDSRTVGDAATTTSAGPWTAIAVFQEAALILGTSPTSPALRHALFEVCANVDGVVNVGTTRDRLGRNGLLLRTPSVPLLRAGASATTQAYLILDADSGRILQEGFITERGERATNIFVTGGFVDRVGQILP